MKTSDWDIFSDRAKILVIGHDPRLQESDTQAEYCFFADYYFGEIPLKESEERKYRLAQSLFDHIRDITSSKYKDDEIYITNLCNEQLTKPPENCTVYIPEDKANEGLKHIRQILKICPIEIIFPMSMQVNYWLQALGFYTSENNCVDGLKPSIKGTTNTPPYYKASKSKIFNNICGHRYIADGKYLIFPILHTKNYPLKGKYISTYKENYIEMRRVILDMTK